MLAMLAVFKEAVLRWRIAGAATNKSERWLNW